MTAKLDATRQDVDVFELELEGEALVVVSVPVSRAPGAGTLTAAEAAVAREAVAGRSNAEIARRRGSSPRTVANQLASAYRKLGVVSRAELAARLIGDGTE
jgi:DNA-binding CsgD family transcriptional regulator